MVALIASRSGALLPDDVRRRRLPVVLRPGRHPRRRDRRQGRGLHRAARNAGGRAAKGALEKTVLHLRARVQRGRPRARSARWNRPNQRGPEEMGWRTTAQNFNLNRDYVKSDSPEMQAMLRMIDDVGSARHDRPARDGRREVPARHRDHRGARARGRRGAAQGRPGAARRRDRRPREARSSPAAPSIPRSSSPDDPASGFVDNVAAAAPLARLLLPAQSHRNAGGDALVEGVSGARASDAQYDHFA
mgnify:CR=1 FL=1